MYFYDPNNCCCFELLSIPFTSACRTRRSSQRRRLDSKQKDSLRPAINETSMHWETLDFGQAKYLKYVDVLCYCVITVTKIRVSPAERNLYLFSESLLNLSITRPKPAYGRQGLDRRAKIQFWGFLNVSLRAFGAQLG